MLKKVGNFLWEERLASLVQTLQSSLFQCSIFRGRHACQLTEPIFFGSIGCSRRPTFPDQLLAQLQEGDTLTAEAMGASRAMRAENEVLQKQLEQVGYTCIAHVVKQFPRNFLVV